ncbi:uncharacterized protein LOC128203347 [Mya arenaria]|uniref:uncharacterized protein LOC128203347 n=1 Tax=Mya arenaria TaxID=6604 RepID=UPI0022E44A7E|nr:uncharacterized protein LOC128203347 [Mya arenaria]
MCCIYRDMSSHFIIVKMTRSFVFLVLNLALANGDYECVCNYNVELPVYDHPNEHSSSIGYLYEFDCKPKEPSSEHPNFLQIMFEGQEGFVKIDNNVQPQTCPGNIPPSDLVTTIKPHGNEKTTTTLTETTTTPTTTASTTTTSTTITTPTTTTTTTPTPSTTTSTTTTHRTTSTSTEHTTTTPTPNPTSIPEGHIELCPAHVRNDLSIFKGFLGQYGDYCFELVDVKTQWHNAQRHCTIAGNGFIVHVTNQLEQDYFVRFLSNHTYVESVWLGLTDSEQEGATAEGKWTWISGAPVTFTKFGPDFNSESATDHKLHDCVIMKNGGEWTDVSCGVALVLGTGFGESHPFICQYNVTSKPPSLFGHLTDALVG